ncbi:MAG: NADH-quinone oxidoreductase subunit N [Fibrobacteria bacterium]|nr:NADH-quinone oxidoreductase subunit N [Fibrobacteria bacterium]
MSNLESLGHIVPELILGGMAVLIFLVAAAARKHMVWRTWLFPALTVAGLVAAIGHLCYHSATLSSQGAIFSGLLASDAFAVYFRILVITAVLVCVFISIGSSSLSISRSGEYHGLLLVMAMGMCFLAGANNLLMIYISLETVSLCSYLLTGWDHKRIRSHEAGLKYVLFGGVASGIMLFGFSIMYGLFGSLNLQDISVALNSNAICFSSVHNSALLLSLVFILGGMGYKIAAVPFHMWCPDVYEGAPTPITALLSVGPKAVGFALIIRFFYSLFIAPVTCSHSLETVTTNIPWLLILAVLSISSMILGNFAALVQNNLKRMLAYSSIAHAGYTLMGVIAGGQRGLEAVAIYLGIYLLMNMGAFSVVSIVARTTGSEDINVFRGLGKRMPVMGLMMTIFLVSLTGLPPTAGFIGKFYLFSALLETGGYWYWILAVIGVLNSVVALYYYARVMKAMYFEKPEGEIIVHEANTLPAAAVALVLGVLTLFFGIFWQPLADAASWSAAIFH